MATQPAHWTVRLPRLEGRLVSLSEVKLADAAQINDFLSDERVYRHVSPPPRNAQEVEAWIARVRFRRGDGVVACFAIRIQNTDSLVGIGQVIPVHGGAEWGWSLTPAMWGTGAFIEVAGLLRQFARTSLGATELVARVAAANSRAERALLKIGSELVDGTGPVRVWRTSTLDQDLPTRHR